MAIDVSLKAKGLNWVRLNPQLPYTKAKGISLGILLKYRFLYDVQCNNKNMKIYGKL